jgi:hypothetical protein
MTTETRRARIERAPIVPTRVRRIGGQGFCFIPHRFLREGFFAALSAEELVLYLLLVLAGDRHGLSFYHQDSLCSLLELPMHVYLAARNGLIDKDLIAFDGRRFQVLSLPQRPVRAERRPLTSAAELEQDDPATIRQLINSSLAAASRRRR